MGKRSWKCRLGLHDWEVLETKNWGWVDWMAHGAQTTADEEARKLIGAYHGPCAAIPIEYDRRVCLRCGQFVDETESAVIARKAEIAKIETRRIRAAQLTARADPGEDDRG